MLSLFTIIAGLLVLYLMTFPYNLARNYITARKTGLPIIVVPIDQNHFIWMVTSVSLRPIIKVRPSGSAVASSHRKCRSSVATRRANFLIRNISQKASSSDYHSPPTAGSSIMAWSLSKKPPKAAKARPSSWSPVAVLRSAHAILRSHGRSLAALGISASRTRQHCS